MHCGVMVTGYNQGDWERLMAGDYDRPPDGAGRDPVRCHVARSGSWSSRWASTRSGRPSTTARRTRCSRTRCSTWRTGRGARHAVDVGTAVVVVPWWNPVRLAERDVDARHPPARAGACISGSAAASRPTSTRRSASRIERVARLLLRVVDILRAADGAERFSYDGEVFTIPPTTIRPQARHKGELTIDIKARVQHRHRPGWPPRHGLGQMFVAGRRPRAR